MAPSETNAHPLLVCSYEDRPAALDGLVFMAESLFRVDPAISLHLTVPDAPPAIRAWAQGRPEVTLSTERPDGVSGWDVKPWLLLHELSAGCEEVLWLDADMIVTRPVSSMVAAFPPESLIVAEEWFLPEPRRLSSLWGPVSYTHLTPSTMTQALDGYHEVETVEVPLARGVMYCRSACQ